MAGDERERRRDRAGLLQMHVVRASDQVGKWTCESVNAGSTQRPPRSTRSGVGSIHSCVPTPPATIGPAMASAPQVGSEGSSVRMTPFRGSRGCGLYWR